MPYNPKIHHRRSIRLQGYDYSQEGLYFITICCQDRAHLFGKITNGEMVLNDAGIVADICWMDIPKHFPNAVLHEYIVMPNHIHGIIELSSTVIGAENFLPRQADITLYETGAENFLPRQADITLYETGAENFLPRQEDITLYETGAENFLPRQEDITLYETGAENFLPRTDDIALFETGAENFQPRQRQQNEFQKMIPRSIGSIVKGFKIGVTKWFRNQGKDTIVWQRNYYEHIIRDDRAYQCISEYIINNPTKWSEDKFYKL